MSFVSDACREIRPHLHPGMLIILESTTYPGTTEEVIRPELQHDGLNVGRSFGIGDMNADGLGALFGLLLGLLARWLWNLEPVRCAPPRILS